MSKVLLLGAISLLLPTVVSAGWPTGNLQLFNIVGRAVGYEAFAVTRFKHNLRGRPCFYLDQYNGRAIAIAEQGVGMFPHRFSVLTSDGQQHIDLRGLGQRGILSDFLALDRLPGFLFTLDHYVFWGKHKVYLVDRQQMTIKMVVSHHDSLRYRVIRSQLLTDDLIAILYRNDDHEEYLQIISIDDLTISHQQEVNGTLLGVTDEFIISQKGSTLVVFNHRQGQQQLYTVFDPLNIQLANNLLIVASSDKTLSLIDLASKQLQRVVLDSETPLVITRTHKVIMQLTDDTLYLTYGRQLSKVQGSSRVIWQRQLSEQPRHLQVIDSRYLLVVLANQINIIDQENGNIVLGITSVADQHLEKATFVDRYLSLIVENNFHHGGQFQFSLVQIPLVRLLELTESFPLLQKIVHFTLMPVHTTFSDFVLTAVDSFLDDNPNWRDKQQLLQLIRALATTSSLPRIDNYLKDHG